MTRKEFYKKYYTLTGRVYSDNLVLTKKQREEAWRKGQSFKVSKPGRKLWIVLQYLLLGVCIFFLCHGDVILSSVCLFLSVLSATLSNFSFIKIELLYRIFFSGNTYGEILRDEFFGDMDPFLNGVRKNTKKYVHGYYSSASSHAFKVKYKAVPKDKNNRISVMFTCKRAKVKVNGRKTVIRTKSITRDELFERISTVINEELSSEVLK